MILDKETLLSVQRPGRYIGKEYNTYLKDFHKAKAKIVLAFPDIYELGMSNLGLRILYDILNRDKDTLCERVFSPWHDMERVLRQKQIKLFSLENQIPIDQFDLVGFSLNHELNYTNVLNMLDLAQLEIEFEKRKDTDPIVIAGGMCCLNPAPIKPIFDAFIVGEAEAIIIEIAAIFKKHKIKQQRLEALAQLEGVYLPAIHKNNHRINKVYVDDFSAKFSPEKWMVPYLQIVHDRVSVELMRGCPNSCLFCQARSAYWPLRIRKTKDIITTALKTLEDTGYE